MAQYKTVFHTLTKILPRHEIDRLDRRHEIDRLDRKYGQGDKQRKSSRYVQFIVMLMAQILGLKSLREIEQAQKSRQKGIQTPFRLIHYISPDDQHEYHFITNAMHLPAQTIADIFYKERWQIELFFKWVKQNLKIKTLLGTSANAVMTQVWVALCLYLILAFIRFIPKTVHSMREILNWIRINLFSNEILDDYLTPKMTEPIVNSQLTLF